MLARAVYAHHDATWHTCNAAGIPSEGRGWKYMVGRGTEELFPPNMADVEGKDFARRKLK